MDVHVDEPWNHSDVPEVDRTGGGRFSGRHRGDEVIVDLNRDVVNQPIGCECMCAQV